MDRLYTRTELVKISVKFLLLAFLASATYLIYSTISPTFHFWMGVGALFLALLIFQPTVVVASNVLNRIESGMSAKQSALYRTVLQGGKIILIMCLGMIVYSSYLERPDEVVGAYILFFALFLKNAYTGFLEESKGVKLKIYE